MRAIEQAERAAGSGTRAPAPRAARLPRVVTPSVLALGLLLLVPACGSGPPPAPPSDDGPPIVRTGRREHTVHSGETIASIARLHGVSTETILGANPSVVPERLAVGTVLVVPLKKPEVRRVRTLPASGSLDANQPPESP